MIDEERFKELVADANTLMFQQLHKAWKEDRLADVLKKLGLDSLISQEISPYWEDSCRNGKIIIFGESTIKEREIYASFKTEHIAKERIEIHLGYEKMQTYNFQRLRYNSNYRLILVGALPHSAKGKGDFSSIITMMETTDGYTKVRRLCSNGQLKITKSNLKQTIHEEIENGYLAA